MRHLPGNVRVVVKNNFVGVVADREWHAVQAAAALKAPWSPGPSVPAQSELYAFLRRQPSATRCSWIRRTWTRSWPAPPRSCARRTTIRIRCTARSAPPVPWPTCSRAEATIWSATQAVYPLRSTAAMLLKRRPEDVRVIFRRGPGCYGINGADTVSYDAVLLSQAVGRPVRVLLTRKDEMAWENYGDPFVLEQRAGLDAAGDIVAWDHESWSASRGGRPGYNAPGNVVTGMLAGFALPRARAAASARADGRFRNGQNAAPSYVRDASAASAAARAASPASAC